MNGETLDANEIAEMALRLHSEPSSVETVESVLTYALRAVDCDFAGVIFLHTKTSQVETISATDPLIEKLDQIQMEIGQGPDIEALTERVSVIVDDTLTERRWPQWADMVASAGIRSLLNVRLYTSDEVLGTLNLYSTKPNKFDTDDQGVAHVLARHAAVAIAAARKEENLWQAVDARRLIGQAQGILMERYDLDSDKAFGVLVRYSQDHNIKLRDVARDLIETRKLPDSGS
ncbi:MAG: GAF and ANTAR domain-containing protein [Marmoricola sp.]